MAQKTVEGAELIKEIQRLELRPNDVIVVRAEQGIRPEFRVYLQKQISRLLPGHHVLVIDGPIELFALGQAEVEETG